MKSIAFALLSLLMLSSVHTQGDEPTVAELQQQVRELQAEVEKLSAVLEGTARPINLGRTDFAAVSAASSNGGRSPGNKFYGIRNAFDGGENWHNNINYSYWLSAGGQSMYVEVRFDHPVTVTSILLDGGPACSPIFTFHKGGEEPHGKFSGEFKPPRPLHGVTGVRLNFGDQTGNIQVNEIHVRGYPHPDVKYKVTRPRLILDERAAVGNGERRISKRRLSAPRWQPAGDRRDGPLGDHVPPPGRGRRSVPRARLQEGFTRRNEAVGEMGAD